MQRLRQVTFMCGVLNDGHNQLIRKAVIKDALDHL